MLKNHVMHDYRLYRLLLLHVSAAVLGFLPAAVQAHAGHPLGQRTIEWHPDAAIARTLALNYDAHAGRFMIGWSSVGEMQSVDGRKCLKGPYFLFDVDDAVAFDTDVKVTIELLFKTTGSQGAYVTYDHVVEPATREVRFDDAAKDDWQHVEVVLHRARFANRKYGGTDFGVGALGATSPRSQMEPSSITLCDVTLTFSAAAQPQRDMGRLAISLRDEEGKSLTARVGLYDDEGRSPLAGPSALRIGRYTEEVKQLSLLNVARHWPGRGRYVFYVDGDFRQSLPAGRYQLVVGKGPEFEFIDQDIEILEGKMTQLDLTLRRWDDLPASGWFSGDGHIHLTRDEPGKNPGIAAFTSAEDIHLANLLQMGNLKTWYYSQYAFGHSGHFLSDQYALVSGQESPRTAHLGHTIGLNGKSFHWLSGQHYLYGAVAAPLRREGGLFGFAHVALAGAFDLQRGLALGVALGYVDFLEILQMGVLNTRYFYDFLNMGFRLLPSAGSDFPYIDIPGSDRMYVQVGENFSVEGWFSAWKTGRSFVSNAPIIEFSINGDTLRSDYAIRNGEALDVNVSARVNPDWDKLARLELVVQGDVFASVTSSEGTEQLQLHERVLPEDSLWLAFRATGVDGTTAHSAPVYVVVDGNQRFWKREAVPELAVQYANQVSTLYDQLPDLFGDFESFDTEDVMLKEWKAAKPELDVQLEQAIQVFRALKREAEFSAR